MGNKYIKISFIVGAFSFFSALVIIFLRYYNSPKNVEERCSVKFQKAIGKVAEKTDEEWGLNMDIATDNYFKCMNIP